MNKINKPHTAQHSPKKIRKQPRRHIATKKPAKSNKPALLHTSNAQFSSLPENPAAIRNMNRPSTGLYRDCLRLIDYMAGKSIKAQKLRVIIRDEFDKNRNETDPTKVEQMKSCAVQGLANYLTIESLAKAGNRYTAPGANVQMDESHFNRRRSLQQPSNQLSIEELQALEAEGPQEYAGVRVTHDFASHGVDLANVPKDDKPQFVKDLVDSKNQV